MATLKQIDANRRNAQKSTGPRTEAGKAASRLNALKTALHAESLVIPGEDPEALAVLTREFHDRWEPATPEESALVDRLVHSEWIIRRLRAIEAPLWHNAYAKYDAPDIPPTAGAQRLGFTYMDIQLELSRLQSRLNSLDRTFHRALMDLKRLQKERRDVQAAAEPAPQPAQKKPPQSEIGFVPENDQSAVPDAPPAAPGPDFPVRRYNP